MDRIKFIYEHPFYPGLRGQPLPLDDFASNLARLTDREITAIFAAIPDGFGKDYLDRIGAHLRAARDGKSAMLDAIRRILQ